MSPAASRPTRARPAAAGLGPRPAPAVPARSGPAPDVRARTPGLGRLAAGGATALLLVCVTGLVAWPWLARDLIWQRIPDALIHLVRIFAVDAALGRWPG